VNKITSRLTTFQVYWLRGTVSLVSQRLPQVKSALFKTSAKCNTGTAVIAASHCDHHARQ
jgi:hypothetical protein